MQRDISELLSEWPYEQGQIKVRLIEGNDGLPRIQVRLDLGILQMTTEGRPDGQQPFGYDSLLEYFEQRLDATDGASESGAGLAGEHGPPESYSDDDEDEDDEDHPDAERFKLSSDDCKALREEAAQYYHRYIALLVLEDYEGVVRDTTRNLRVLDLCREHAEHEDDRETLEKVRPYILMMRARALASQALRDEEPKAAVHAIDEGLAALKAHFEQRGEPEEFERSGEADMLRDMRKALIPKLPVSQKSELRQRLREAIARENYELAAILRDELRMLGG